MFGIKCLWENLVGYFMIEVGKENSNIYNNKIKTNKHQQKTIKREQQ